VATTGSMPKANGRTEEWFAVLGRRDNPTDGVEDYCSFLGQALSAQGVRLQNVRVLWPERGWLQALLDLWRESRNWRSNWVLLQYTAMAWSRRGFPFGAVAVASILRRRGARIAVIFHEPFRQGGQRWIDRCRGTCQDWVVQALYRRATKAIFADPLSTIGWIRGNEPKTAFVPIGPNLPTYSTESAAVANRNGNTKTVVVFCLSDPPNRTRELEDIRHAMQFVQEHGVKSRVVFLGRGTVEAKGQIEQLFRSTAAEVSNLGLRDADELSRIFLQADAMLCVRGPLYPRRGSAIAGIACGLPVVGYAGAAEGTPLEEAGVQLVPYGNREMLGQALANVLTDEEIWKQLHEKSLRAYRSHFSWDIIAARMQRLLHQATGAET